MRTGTMMLVMALMLLPVIVSAQNKSIIDIASDRLDESIVKYQRVQKINADTALVSCRVDTVRTLIYFIDTARRMYGTVMWQWGWKIMTMYQYEEKEYFYEYESQYLTWDMKPFRQSMIKISNK